MLRKVTIAIALFFLAASAASASPLVASLWPHEETAEISEVGRGVAVIFSPDLSVPGNCRFYVALGFACFQDTDWSRVLDGIQNYNSLYPERAIRTVVLETHGTNGHGLKLQKNYEPKAERSYISVGALQEQLEDDGVEYIVLSACNSGRLLRPEIYRVLNPNPGDKLFGPATCGIFSATPQFEPERSSVTVVMPATSRVESTVVGQLKELAPATRKRMAEAAKQRGVQLPKKFAVSDMLMLMLLRDPRLQLTTEGYVETVSRNRVAPQASEKVFKAFLSRLNTIAKQQEPPRASDPQLASGRSR